MVNFSGPSIIPSSAPQDIDSLRTHGARKVSAAAREFESILIGQWLQAGESSFGSAPGGQDDADTGGEQMQGFAVQRLAVQLAGSGGIGIAQLVQNALTRSSGGASTAHVSGQDKPVQPTADWIPEESGR